MDALVDKCKEPGSTKYIFCGYDHESNAGIAYDSIAYTYGFKTGHHLCLEISPRKQAVHGLPLQEKRIINLLTLNI